MSVGKKQGTKTYELAEELGVKPREVMRIARALGIPAQNRLTRIERQAAQRIRAQVAAERGVDHAAVPSASDAADAVDVPDA